MTELEPTGPTDIVAHETPNWGLDKIDIIPPTPQTADELLERARLIRESRDRGEVVTDQLSLEEQLYLQDRLYRYGVKPPDHRATFTQQVDAAEKRAGIRINAPYDAS